MNSYQVFKIDKIPGFVFLTVETFLLFFCFSNMGLFNVVFFTGKVEPTPHTSSFNMGYLVSPYPYHNGTAGPIPVSMVSQNL